MSEQNKRAAEIEQEIADLGRVRKIFGDKQVDQKIAALRAEQASLVQTGGGTYVAGGVDTHGGMFVGRDYIANPNQPPDELLRAYYRSMAEECCRLPLGVIDTRFVKTRGEVSAPLPDIYVDLNVVNPPPPEKAGDERAWALSVWRGEGRERAPLLDALLKSHSRRSVLLGEAGSGKTTFVNYLAYLLAGSLAQGEPLPALPEALHGSLVVRLALREAAARCIPKGTQKGDAQVLWRALQDDIASRLGEQAAKKLLEHLQKRLVEEGGVILLDGLDEAPEAQRRRAILLEAAAAFTAVLPDQRTHWLVTARPYAYADRAWHLQGFDVLALAAFNEKQIEGFIQRWYQAVRPSMGWSKAEANGRAERLSTALGQRAYLADLACRPLLLTLMATLHSSWGQLPEDRADLYEETVKLLLGRWQRARQTQAADGSLVIEAGIQQALGVGEERLRSVLEALAFNAHQRQGQGKQRDEAPADISEGDLLLAFKPLLGQLDPDVLTAYLKERAGLLIARREGVYSFPHRSFQEYLAACWLANQPEFAMQLEKLACADPLWWREVCLLGVGKARQGGLSQAANVVSVLLPDDPPAGQPILEKQWRVAALAGQALLELRLTEKGGEQAYYQSLLRRARRWLVALLGAGALNARERAAAGDVLGRLGDPRFRADRWHLPDEPLLGFVEIPAGPFRMGSDLQKDRYAQKDEQPQHKVDLPAFYMARYPVTVAQFRAFVQDSGYQSGDPDSLKDESTRPVKYVSWHEALAYCQWLNEKLRQYAGNRRDGGIGDKGIRGEGRLSFGAGWRRGG